MTSPMPLEELQTCRDLLAMLQDENGEVAEYWGKMLADIDALSGQIEALKEKLITEKSYHLYYKCQGDCGRVICSAGAHKKEARRQLAKEMPVVFGDD